VRNRILGTVGVLLAIALIIFLLLPVWASTERGRAFVLEQINKKLNGTVNCDRWRLSWFRGIKIEGLTVHDAMGARLFQCREIHTDMTLWGYMWGSYALGNTRVLEPRLQANKYSDGSNDLEHVFAGTAAEPGSTLNTWFNSLSGLIKIERGEVTLLATNTPVPLHFNNISAEIPIASPQAHIHVLLHADTETIPNTLTAEGNLPPLDTWLANPAALAGDLEVHANNIPTAALARWMELDGSWEQAFGPAIDTLTYVSEAHGETSNAELSAYAATGSIEARVRVESHPDYFIVSIPDSTHYLRVNGRMCEPVARTLRYVNPLFGQAAVDSGTVALAISSGGLDLRAPGSATASAQLFCNRIRLRPGALLGDIVSLAGQRTPQVEGGAPLAAAVGAMRIAIAQQRITCDNATFTLPPSRQITFSGYVELGGALHLRVSAKVDAFSEMPNTLGSGSVEAPVTGTVDKPVLESP
jgi:hypothetical protein